MWKEARHEMKFLKGENIRRYYFIAENSEPAFFERDYGSMNTIFELFAGWP